MTARIVVLASGGGTNLEAILCACADGRIDGRVLAVVSDRGGAHALERARRWAVAATFIDPKRAQGRRAYDSALADAVAAHEPEWIVLAGWMRILSTAFVGRFPDRVVNLHPARPGEFAGLHAIQRAFDEARAGLRTSTGVMVHLVPDERVDAGPVLGTVDVPIRPTDTLADLEERMHCAEHELLVDVLRSLCAPARAADEPVGRDPIQPDTFRPVVHHSASSVRPPMT